MSPDDEERQIIHGRSGHTFEEDIQYIPEEFMFPEVTRRQIFSPLAGITHQQTTEKAIPNDKTSGSSESTT
tara:strand:+ start:332 stop:544 length:213 start_codon:yes stop_codon:yes gene_type:complete